MGSLELIALLVAVAAMAALGGFVAQAGVRRRRRRTRAVFLVGFACGVFTGRFMRHRHVGLKGLSTVVRRDDVLPQLAGIARNSARLASRALYLAQAQNRRRVPPSRTRQLRLAGRG